MSTEVTYVCEPAPFRRTPTDTYTPDDARTCHTDRSNLPMRSVAERLGYELER